MSGTKNKNYEMDMCNGHFFAKILRFALPLALTGILQLLYNAADIIVVGRYAGSESLAAVGSTTALIHLIINIFIGLSVGCSVVVAKYYGAKDHEKTQKTVHTSMLLSGICGVGIGLFGYFFCRYFLIWMSTPEDVLNLSTLYLKIYFIGMPANMIYNFGSAVLRGVGDTRRPLYFLTVAGIINVILNLIFVICFGMGVKGVAVATVISQIISAVCVVWVLIKEKGYCHLSIKKLHIHKAELYEILKVGLPAGFQGALFSVSNVIIQSSINSFGSVVMAGNAAASNIEGFVYISMNSIYHAALAFTGQNYGANKPENFNKVLYNCLIIVTIIGVSMGMLAWVFGRQLTGIYSTSEEVINYSAQRIAVICTTYCLCGIMDVLAGQLRGIGYSLLPMIITIISVCAFRIIWVYTAFAADRSLLLLYLSYPISWTVASVANYICYIIVKKKVTKKLSPLSTES